MKVIQINCVYNEGSTGKITADIHRYLKDWGIDSKVLYGRGAFKSKKDVIRLGSNLYGKINAAFSRISGLMYGGCYISTKRAIKIISQEKPDIVHIQCINGNFINIYHIIQWLKEHAIQTVLTLHAEFMYTANCGYALECDKWKFGCGNCPRLKKETKSFFIDNTHRSWELLKKAYEGFDTLSVVSVSPWLEARAVQSPMLAEKKHFVILNGLDVKNVFKHYETGYLKRKYGLDGEKIVLHVTPFFSADKEHVKGGYYLLKLAESFKTQPIKFIVVGKYDPNIIVPKNVILLGKISDQIKLAKLYSMADVTLLVSRKETFSMVTAESLCCGTPVVGFRAGAPEEIALSQYSEFVEYGNNDKLYCALLKWINKDIPERIDQIAAKEYDRLTMCKKYFDLYRLKCLQGEKKA